MRRRRPTSPAIARWGVLPALALSIASISCPWTEDRAPSVEAEPPRPSPVPSARPAGSAEVAPTRPAPVLALPALPSAEASVEELPPELVDDGSDDVKELEVPEAPPEPVGPRETRETREAPDQLASTAKETWVFAEPSWKGRRIGYLRAGAIVTRSKNPVAKNHSCPDGWYRVAPKGFVCVGAHGAPNDGRTHAAYATATLNVSDVVVETSAKRPRRDGLPYTYVMARHAAPPPLYTRLPSATELATAEPDIKSQLRRASRMMFEPGYVAPPPAESVPGVLLYGRSAPALGGEHRSPSALTLGHALARSGFALLSTFDYEERRYGLTTELAVLPLDRTRVIQQSSFHGLKLDDEVTLPVAFVKSHHATRFVSAAGGGLVRGAALGFREAVPITGAERRVGGEDYFVAKDGSLILASSTVRVDRPKNLPAWSATPRRWIDVSILRQALVAYEGSRPIYVTLVSTGADGLGDPKKTHSTIQGTFLIHTKHVSVTMDDDKVGDEFDFRDVPFVQYFTEGFALHGAYWHDEFGTPRSHGCVNLAPIDAAWLFNWTDPEVPPDWHAALSLKRGTLVHIHP